MHALQDACMPSCMLPDSMWMAEMPRYVNHVDDHFIQSVTALYRQRIPRDGAVLDLMSSHVSHLPRDNSYSKVIGHGMNAMEVSTSAIYLSTSGTDLAWQMKFMFPVAPCPVRSGCMLKSAGTDPTAHQHGCSERHCHTQ